MAADEPQLRSLSLTVLLALGCADDPRLCGEGWGMSKNGSCEPLATLEDTDTAGPVAGNTAPTAPRIALSPAQPRAGGTDLICRVEADSVDIDGDTLRYVFSWQLDGAGYLEAIDGAEAGDTVPGEALEQGQQFKCTVAAHDGITLGPSRSAKVEVGSPYVGWDEQLISLSESEYVLRGEGAWDGAGGWVAPAGDVDGDGLADMLIASYWNDEAGVDAGKSYLFLGKDLGAERTISLADAAWGFVGEVGRLEDDPDCEVPDPVDGRCGGDWAGHSLNSAGDVDGDGRPDIVLSGYRSDDLGYDVGKTYLVLAASLEGRGSLGLGSADVQIYGENVSDRMGHSVHSAGDVDGDGRADIVTGAYGHDAAAENAGRAYLVLSDTLAGASSLYFPEDADFIWDGEAAGDESGYISAPAGDIDGDGLGDFMTTSLRNQEGGAGLAPGGEHGAGKVYVILGASLDLTDRGAVYSLGDVDRAWLGESGGDAVGYGIGPVGDFDGDGLSDLMAGSYGNSEGGDAAGKVHVMTAASMATPGTISLADAEYGFVGESAEAWLGFGAGPAGDVDQDGLDDVFLGAAWHSDENTFSGRAYLVLAGGLSGPGTHSVADSDHIFVGEEAWDNAGYKLTGLGDVSGDGMPDLLVASWQGDRPEDPGKVHIVLNP
jgi:hypothetical protein